MNWCIIPLFATADMSRVHGRRCAALASVGKLARAGMPLRVKPRNRVPTHASTLHVYPCNGLRWQIRLKSAATLGMGVGSCNWQGGRAGILGNFRCDLYRPIVCSLCKARANLAFIEHIALTANPRDLRVSVALNPEDALHM